MRCRNPIFFISLPPPPSTHQDYVDRAPGELGEFGAFAKPVDKEEWDKVQMAELKHGRLAMLGVVGCLVQELVTGEGPVEQLLNGNVRGRMTQMEKGEKEEREDRVKEVVLCVILFSCRKVVVHRK